jgi:hypothetical protein
MGKDEGLFQDLLSLREMAGVKGSGMAVSLGNSPHPNPLPEGEGIVVLAS